MRRFNASDVGIDLDRFEDRRPVGGFIFEGDEGPWSMFEHARAFVDGSCPGCHGKPRGRKYCLVCDRCGFDGRVTYPGLPIGQHMDPEWQAQATIYVAHVGGVGPAEGDHRGLRKRLRKRRSRQTV